MKLYFCCLRFNLNREFFKPGSQEIQSGKLGFFLRLKRLFCTQDSIMRNSKQLLYEDENMMSVQNIAQFFSRFKYIRGFAVIDVVVFVMNCCHCWLRSLILFVVSWFFFCQIIYIQDLRGVFKQKDLPEI